MNRAEYAQKLSKYTLLIVDDDEILMESMAKMYKRYFKEIFTANDGFEGIELYRQHRPDIVVSDVTMPKCDGITMAKELKEFDPDLKIIFATGHNEEEYLKEFDPFGDSITKPIDITVLLESILAILEGNS